MQIEFAPDHIFHNGMIVTADRHFSIVQALAVYEGKVVALGSDRDMLSLSGRRTTITDLGGRFVLPGQVDGYAHCIYSGVERLGDRGKLDIMSLRSVVEIVQAIAERAASTPAGQWIATGLMYRGALEEGRWPTREDLDVAASSHPVYIMQGGRPIIANTRALTLAGIDRDTPDPTDPPGRIVRDSNGEPTGQLIGGAADLARKEWAKSIGMSADHWDLSWFDVDALVDAICAQQKVFHACGVTTVRDKETTRREVWAWVQARGALQTHMALCLSIPARYWSEDDRHKFFEGFFEPWPLGDDLLWLDGISVTHDLEGWMILDEKWLEFFVLEAGRRGWKVEINPSIGGNPKFAETALTILEKLDDEMPIRDRRFVFFHPGALRESRDIERAKHLGVTVNPNPLLHYHAAARSLQMHDAVRVTGLHGATEEDAMAQARKMWGLPIRDWLEGGIVVSAGSNTPAAIYDLDHPFLGQYSALTGDTLAGVLLEGQAIDREAMIRIFTTNGAYSLGREDVVGSLHEGSYADFVIVDRDLLTVPDREIAEAKVLQTYFQGSLVYER